MIENTAARMAAAVLLRRAAAVPVLLASIVCMLLAPALAHHGVSRYDMDEVRTLEGVVESWNWGSPHTGLTLSVEREDGAAETWEIEGAPPQWMDGQGWTPESLEAGERVTIVFHPLRRPANGGILMEVERGDGEVLKVNRPAALGGP